MAIAIIGATGKLSGLTIDALLHGDVPAGDIPALGVLVRAAEQPGGLLDAG